MRLLRYTLFGIAAAGLACMVWALFLQVLAREFRLSVDWTEELGRFCFIAMVFFAAAYGTLTRSHLRVSVFSDLLAKVIGMRAIDFLHTVVLIGFSAVMAFYSWLNFVDGLQYPNISPAIGFNQNYLFVAMFTGFSIILILHLNDLLTLLRGKALKVPQKDLGDE